MSGEGNICTSNCSTISSYNTLSHYVVACTILKKNPMMTKSNAMPNVEPTAQRIGGIEEF
jgi:hypothetical protein